MTRVLLVDDDTAILDALTDALDDRYVIEVARDGREALHILDGGAIDVVILDLMMPVMDGESFMREAIARGHTTPVVIASAARDAGATASSLGAVAVLPKPYRLDELIRTIDRFGGGGGSGASTSTPAGGAAPAGPGSDGVGARRARRVPPLRPLRPVFGFA